MILRIHHAQITVPLGAENAAREFYCGCLGLREVPKPAELQSRGGLWLSVGDGQLHIGVEDGVDRGATKAHVAYEVDDLAAVTQALRRRGIETRPGVPIDGYERCELRDPFGNRVELLAGRRRKNTEVGDSEPSTSPVACP